MDILSIDIETFSKVNLAKCGVYAYSDCDSFEILLFAYAFNNDQVEIVDLAKGENLPGKVIKALQDEKVIKTAFNAVFERTCLSKYLGIDLSPQSWLCTQVQSAMLALPASLESVGEILNIKSKKMKEGKDLIKFFCLPCKPTKNNNYKERNLPTDAPDKWEIFKEYCIRDVICERQIRERLSKFPISHSEMEIYKIDQEINDRGILVDINFVNKAIECDLKHKEKITSKLYELTKIENPNSLLQMKNWLKDQGVMTDSLDKKSVKKLIKTSEGKVKEVLKLRQLMSKTSVKKYEAIKRCVTKDKRVHGLFQFYGANRTGRWAGRLVQVQNLPQNHIKDLSLARDMVKSGEYEKLELLEETTPNILSQLIRTAFVPRAGYEFVVADFSSIEARVLAWISNEQWRIKVFESHGKIYEASAAEIFNVPINEVTKGSSLRQKGKIAELALGYGGSVGALTIMGALEKDLKEEELLPLVKKWRRVNSNITKFWWDVGNAAIRAVKEKMPVTVGKITFSYESGMLFIKLPSGRRLAYVKPRMGKNKFGTYSLTYEGIGEQKKWTRIETYGPKLVENIVQGISRDILAYAMLNIRNEGGDIVMHVHDEVVVEVKKDEKTVDEICDIMTIVPPWAKNLPLRAEGYKCDFYKKE
ncbi:DNA polymerase [Terrisporobacter petrolearius]|uniref:DNA polymerase n=1 Tax=Terrisporobacter petrolearius TaxID=1460447 RepID=UPI003B00C906